MILESNEKIKWGEGMETLRTVISELFLHIEICVIL